MAIDSSNSKTIFNPQSVTAWRAESKKPAAIAEFHQAALVKVNQALELLDHLVCLKNPLGHNPIFVRQAIFKLFNEAAQYGLPLAMFFEGLCESEGFGCKPHKEFGLAKINVAVARGCPEALNYAALCTVGTNFLRAFKMLHTAALAGHTQGLRNYQILARHVQDMLRNQSRVVAFPESSRPTIPSSLMATRSLPHPYAP
jgi:hypothetical protein